MCAAAQLNGVMVYTALVDLIVLLIFLSNRVLINSINLKMRFCVNVVICFLIIEVLKFLLIVFFLFDLHGGLNADENFAEILHDSQISFIIDQALKHLFEFSCFGVHFFLILDNTVFDC